jgi:uncharacterized membrane protein
MEAFKNFRGYFFRGLAALLPTILTIWLFVQFYVFVQEKVSSRINRGVVKVVVALVDWYPTVSEEQKKAYAIKQEPELQANPQALTDRIDDEDVLKGARIQEAERYWVEGPGQITGFIVAFIAVCVLGAFLASVVGKTLWRMFERALVRMPLVRKVYPYIKQVTDFLLTKKGLSFNEVVALQYPRRDVWSIGLVTGKGLKKVSETEQKEFLTVFVPTSPTPFTGYVIMTPKDETIALDMTIEEAMRFTISGGVITPAEHKAFQALSGKGKEKGDNEK